jgi:hydroxymethylpyrimidine pyrophosphatase-like HAD family hydrolase
MNRQPGEAAWMADVTPVQRPGARARATSDRVAGLYDLAGNPPGYRATESGPVLEFGGRAIRADFRGALPAAQPSGRLRDDGDSTAPGRYFRAVAVDYDGTLTTSGRPSGDVLAAIAETRADGRRVVLVTGRILAELRSVFPGVDDHFDAIVGEDGAVAARAGHDRLLAAPVPGELDAALAARGVRFRRGEVLLACDLADEPAVLEAVRELGLECQLTSNRSALMVLPAGVTKGSGLAAALADLGISPHSAAAVGDAENDHSLLATAELGVAVGNAVASLKAAADMVFDQPDGCGVASFLRGPVIAGRVRVHPRRWQVQLGATASGTPVLIPASQLNVLITGTPQRGKSYLAGLFAERLIRLGYCVVVFDPQGDHAGLGGLRGVHVAGSTGHLPSPAELALLVKHLSASMVVDLSGTPAADRPGYVKAAQRELEALRAATGLPHWVIIDEAQVPLARDGTAGTFFEPAASGYCLVTHRTEDLRPEALLAVDVIIGLPDSAGDSQIEGLLAAAGALPYDVAAALARQAGPGQAVLVDRSRPASAVVFTVGQRETSHMRHWHKYSAGQLPADRRFYFRRNRDTATGATAGSITELEHELRACDDAVIAHHCRLSDLSRWIGEVLGDPPLAAAVEQIETAMRAGTASITEARTRLIDAIHRRYQE